MTILPLNIYTVFIIHMVFKPGGESYEHEWKEMKIMSINECVMKK